MGGRAVRRAPEEDLRRRRERRRCRRERSVRFGEGNGVANSASGKRVRKPRVRSFFEDDGGFTSVGMVIALLVTLSLIFTSAQVYRVNAASARVQDVADAAALAAENEVAEYVLVARVADALILSLTLTALVSFGLGVVALCVPGGAGVSEKLLEAGKKITDARDGFSERATQGLDALQKALPFLAAANAAAVAVENGAGTRSSYVAMAVLVPEAGEPLVLQADDGTAKLEDSIDQKAEDVQEDSRKAENAAKKADRAKKQAFERDCGDNPSYCLYERAKTLAGLSGQDNPLYRNLDAWSFKVPLERARAYYKKRLATESPEGSSVRERARSALRKRLYSFAVEQMDRGYVVDTSREFKAFFPLLPSNSLEVRQTELHAEAVYPVTRAGQGALCMHAWAGCPSAAGAVGRGSIGDLEQGGYETCPDCAFTAASMGSVAAASTSIENGFEYHYRSIAQSAREYQQARNSLDPLVQRVQQQVQQLLDQMRKAIEGTAAKRINVQPAGSLGAVALAADLSSRVPSSGLGEAFVKGRNQLGPRAAVAGATLLQDDAQQSKDVISSLLSGFSMQSNAALGATQVVLDCWSWLLKAYAQGQKALTEGVASGLNSIPLASSSGLGAWAAGEITKTVESAGLQSAKTAPLKPVLVNTGSVVNRADEAFAVRFREVKAQSRTLSSGQADVFSTLLSQVEQQAVEMLGREHVIATVEPLGSGGPSKPLTVTLPEPVQAAGKSLVDSLIARLRTLVVQATGVSSWG